jgi:hypothetical protein
MPKNIKINIRNPESLNAPTTKVPEEITVYRWDRIFFALALLIVLLSLVGYGIYSWLSKSIHPQERLQTLHLAKIEAKPVELVTPKQVKTANQTPSLSLASPSPKMVEKKPIKVDKIASDEDVVEPFVQIYPSASEPEKTLTPLAPRVSQPPKAAIPVATLKPTKPMMPPAAPQPVDILIPSIVRARLTHHLKDHEPVDTLGALIPMNKQGLIKVYLFTEMKQLKGKVLYHDWYLNNELMAHVRIPVRYDRTRASSSKFIDRYMTGRWVVKIVDANKKLYATAKFDVPKAHLSH